MQVIISNALLFRYAFEVMIYLHVIWSECELVLYTYLVKSNVLRLKAVLRNEPLQAYLTAG